MRTPIGIMVAGLLSCLVPVAKADVVYQVTVNTGSISGTAGSLDFNFNPGPTGVVQAASADVFNFGGTGTLTGAPSLTGDVSGVLPATVTLDNGTGFNDYFVGFTYGSSLSFDVELSGPAVNSPDGVSTSGSMFAFSMFSDSAGTVPVLTTDTTDGYAITISVNLDGSTTLTNYSQETTGSPLAPVPEPSSLALLGVGLLGLAVTNRRKRTA